MKYLYGFLMLLMLASTGAVQAAEKVYRWVDDEGVTHFTAHPPINRDSEMVRVKTGHSEPPPPPETTPVNPQPIADSGNIPNKQDVKDQYRCSIARENLKILQTSARVQIQEDGEIRYLNEEEQRERAEEARQIIAENC